MTLFPLGLLTLTGNARRFETKRWNSDDTPEPIKKIAQIMIQQLNTRFKLEGIPDASTLLAMKLNPTVNKVRDSFVTMLVVFLTRLVGFVQEAVFSSSQRDAMNEAYELLYNKAASFFFAKRQAEAEAAAQIARPAGSPSPARGAGDGTAAAAARAERPGANRTTGNVLADADAASSRSEGRLPQPLAPTAVSSVMPEQHGAVEPRQLLVRAGRDRVMVPVARVVAEAVGVRQPLVVVGEGRRHRVHELERDAELAWADVFDAGGGELFLDAADGERSGASFRPFGPEIFGQWNETESPVT